MDRYSKFLLTIIALALSLQAYDTLLKPTPAYAIFGGPTYGDYIEGKNRREVLMSAPVVVVLRTLGN